ncbi:Glucose-6-phosphate 1-dehydrogenase [Serratia liquefaciens]|nr:Glucose-6-phosphate 1-dehydrogenase [Serratia liquefaciens]
MRDMIQNHLLQILCMIAMSPPSDLSADSIRDEKVKVLKSLRRIDRSNVREKTVRGQYTAGFAQGKKVPGYLEEEGPTRPATPKPSWRSASISITGAGWRTVLSAHRQTSADQMLRGSGLLQNPGTESV